MIKNLVVTGCSFTETLYRGWSDITCQHVSPANFVNVAKSGAGNFYIADSLIQTLSASDFDPVETLVLVMWTGVTRKDLIVSDEYRSIMPPDHSNAVTKNGIHYVLSGGQVGSWQADSSTGIEYRWLIRPLFEPLYRSSDNKTLGHETLSNIVRTRTFLESHGYNYKFMSYVNYWSGNAGILSRNLDFSLTVHCEGNPLLNQLGDQWIWASPNKDCFFEYAKNRKLLNDDEFHPNQEAHQLFADNIVIPNIKDFL